MDLYRRIDPKPGVAMTIYRGPRKPADKPARASGQQQEEENRPCVTSLNRR